MRSLIRFANKGYLGWAASLAFASSCLLFGCFADPLGKCGIEKWLGGFKGESPQRSRRRAMSASSSVCSRPVRSRLGLVPLPGEERLSRPGQFAALLREVGECNSCGGGEVAELEELEEYCFGPDASARQNPTNPPIQPPPPTETLSAALTLILHHRETGKPPACRASPGLWPTAA